MTAFSGTIVCTYQLHEALTKGLRTNANKDFVKKYKKFSTEKCLLIWGTNNKVTAICERCLEFCKSIGQMVIPEDE
jgi:hypothetical protein